MWLIGRKSNEAFADEQQEAVTKLRDLLVAPDSRPFHLRQSFEDRAKSLQERLFSVGTWLVGLQVALFASPFALGLINVKDGGFTLANPRAAYATFALGFLLAVYASFLLYYLGDHISRNFLRAGLVPVSESIYEDSRGGNQGKKRLKGDVLAEVEKARTKGYLRYAVWFAVWGVAAVHLLAVTVVPWVCS